MHDGRFPDAAELMLEVIDVARCRWHDAETLLIEWCLFLLID